MRASGDWPTCSEAEGCFREIQKRGKAKLILSREADGEARVLDGYFLPYLSVITAAMEYRIRHIERT